MFKELGGSEKIKNRTGNVMYAYSVSLYIRYEAMGLLMERMAWRSDGG